MIQSAADQIVFASIFGVYMKEATDFTLNLKDPARLK